MPGEHGGIDRRSILRAGGALASLSAFGGLVDEATARSGDGGDLARSAQRPGDDGVPREAQSVEAGLQAFAAKWEALGPYIAHTAFGSYVRNTTINCDVAGQPRAYAVEFGPSGGAAVSAGRDPRAHATLALDEEDLLGVLYGEFCPFAPAMRGDAYVPKSEINYASLFGIVLYVFAHLPASVAHDPGFNAENVFGALERRAGEGVDCGGGPSGTAFDPERPTEKDVLGTNDAPAVTEEIATRVAVTTYDDLPERVVAAAKEQLKSIVGVCYAATELEESRRFVEAVRSMERGGDGEATAIAGNSFDASAERAGLVNAYLAQMLEWEDFTWYAHTGSATVPTALAAAEAAAASGEELLTAIALGNEIAGRVGEFASDPTSLGQALPVHQAECPFVAGKLLLGSGPRADDVVVRELQAAAGFAAAQPERTAVGAWPSESKGMIAGSPVRTSIEAAKFADAGLVGRRDLMENPAGLFYALTDVGSPRDLRLAYRGLGEEWFMVDQFYNKRYATNGFFQAAVDAAVDVREQLLDAGIDPAEDTEFVDEVELHMNTAMAATGTLYSAGDASILDEVDRREDFTYTALLYEAYYAVAAALLEGDLTHRQYRPDLRTDHRIRALFERTEAATDLSVGDFGGKVVVRIPDDEPGELRRTLNDREFSATVTCQRSSVDPEDSFGREKLRRAAADTVGSRWRRIDSAVDRIESFDDVNRFTRLL
jgi:2-methylcitrate dehydratase PrpD